MTSSIVRTNPTAGTATTSSVRDNFGFAADEINRLLRASTDKATTANSVSITATFANVPTFTLVDGVRVLLEVAVSNTNASPTLNVNSTGAKSIKKNDGSSLAAGDLVAGGYYEFVYDSGEDEWLVLNLVSTLDQTSLFTTMLGGLYPVGSLLTTTVATNPSTADYFFSGITFGTWEAFAAGKVMVGIDSTDSDFDAVEETGGAKTHTLTQAEMNHNHQWYESTGGSNSIDTSGSGSDATSYDANADAKAITSSELNSDYYTDNNRGVTGESVTAHNNLQPYIVTYIWKRTA
jgi:microcystin-dependent protein